MILLQTLFVISGLGILVRFISNLASGDLLCIVNDLSDNKTNLDIRSFQVENCNKKCRCYSSLSGPFHISLSAYAAQEPGCKDKVKRCPQYFVSGFQQHPHSLHVGPRQLWSSVHVDAGWIQSFLPQIPQALMLLMVEKVSVFFPRMCQKLERFYKSVVEEALLGKFPDVAEDFTSGVARHKD